MASIPKIYVGDQMVTRSKKRILNAFGINGCYVRLETSLKTEVINWLKKTDPKNSENSNNHRNDSKPHRRESVSGASLFSVNNRIQEHSSDYLEKVSRPCAMRIEVEPISAPSFENAPNSIASSSNMVSPDVDCSDQAGSSQSCSTGNISVDGNKKNMVLNNFDPFRRLPNLPFAIRGRARAQSVDCMPSRRPSLSTIVEHKFEYELAAAESLVYDGESDDSSRAIANPAEDVTEALNQLQIDGDNRPILNDVNVMVGTHVEAEMSSHQDAAIVSKWVKRFENFEL